MFDRKHVVLDVFSFKKQLQTSSLYTWKQHIIFQPSGT